MNIEKIISSLEESREFLSFPLNSKQVPDEILEELNALLSQAIEQAKQDDRDSLIAFLDQIDSLKPNQFSLTEAAREHL